MRKILRALSAHITVCHHAMLAAFEVCSAVQVLIMIMLPCSTARRHSGSSSCDSLRCLSPGCQKRPSKRVSCPYHDPHDMSMNTGGDVTKYR